MACFFFHIPKTGGTSTVNVLRNWFPTYADSHLSLTDRQHIEENQNINSCIYGHFGARLIHDSEGMLTRYPWIARNAKVPVFTFVRDPVEHAISVYYHELHHRKTSLSLRDFVKEKKYALSTVLEIAHRGQVEDVLSSFIYVGTTDELQKGIDTLAQIFNKDTIIVPIINRGTRDSQLAEFSESEQDNLRDLLELDYAIYDRVVRSASGDNPLQWSEQEQFSCFSTDNLTTTRAAKREPMLVDSVAAIRELTAVDESGNEVAEMAVTEKLRLRLKFEVFDPSKTVEPALRFMFKAETAFSVAFTPEENTTFDRGQHTVVASLPGNLLNIGQYEIEASLCTPFPTKRYSITPELLSVRVTENPGNHRSARGKWESLFPGFVRPLVNWDTLK